MSARAAERPIASRDPNVFDAEVALRGCCERVRRHRERPIFPQYTEDGVWRLTDPAEARPGFMPEEAAWTAGFWPGMLWIASAVLADTELSSRAQKLQSLLRPRAQDDRTHDLGFVYMPSSVLGFAVSGRRLLLDPAFEAAGTLARRFDERGGYLRAWGEPGSTAHHGLTTIDAMMNAAFVLWMAETTADWRAKALALRHAENAVRNQLRSDGSTAQVARYDPQTGRFLAGETHQGLSAASCWSRGQAWGIYGFALFGLLTRENRFIDAAEAAAGFFMAHLLPSGMAPWDFFDTTPSRTTVDSSAMAIAAAGMLCLAGRTGQQSERTSALKLVETLWARAFIDDESSAALLNQGTFSLPRGIGVNEALIFGDFYFMDALARASTQPFAEYMRVRP
jgi:unsaturated chondroitin disaccharide hydrolase